MNWESLKQALPNTAQFLKLSIQKLRLEYRDKREIKSIWEELGSQIGRRGALRIADFFEIGCGVNSTPLQFPTISSVRKSLPRISSSACQLAPVSAIAAARKRP